MATYYIRTAANGGSDTNNGTSPATAWASLTKALQTGSPVVGGDTIYVGAGTFRGTISVGIAPTSTVSIIGDVDGAKTGDAGEIVISGYDNGDSTLPTSTATLIALGTANFLSFSKLTFMGGKGANIFNNNSGGCHDLTFTDCTLIVGANFGGFGYAFNLFTPTGSAANFLIDRCRVLTHSSMGGCSFTLNRPSGADFDYNIKVQNSQFLVVGGVVIRVSSTGANTFNGGGVKLFNCFFFSGSSSILTADVNLSTSIPAVTATGNILMCGGTGLTANASGQITEDWNLIFAQTARSNVTAGANSVSDGHFSPLMYVGQEHVVGLPSRHFMTPVPGSPLLGFIGTTTGLPAVDLVNRPRPAGGQSINYAAGPLGLHDYAQAGGAGNADGSSGNCIQMTGPGDFDLQIPVDAVATTISIKQKTSGYSGTNYPQISLLANGEIGVADNGGGVNQTVADTTANTNYTTLTLSTFTPTAKGVVTVRLQNRTANGSGIVYWDTVAIS